MINFTFDQAKLMMCLANRQELDTESPEHALYIVEIAELIEKDPSLRGWLLNLKMYDSEKQRVEMLELLSLCQSDKESFKEALQRSAEDAYRELI